MIATYSRILGQSLVESVRNERSPSFRHFLVFPPFLQVTRVCRRRGMKLISKESKQTSVFSLVRTFSFRQGCDFRVVVPSGLTWVSKRPSCFVSVSDSSVYEIPADYTKINTPESNNKLHLRRGNI